MKKDNLMFGIIGLLIGLIIGFMGANSINRSAVSQSPVTIPGAANASSSKPALPPDHPPIGTSGDSEQPRGAALPEITAAIEKAKQKPQDYEAQMAAADLYYQIQRFEDAAKYYEAAAKAGPDEKEPVVKAGDSYFDLAETARENEDQATANRGFAEAEKWYTQALAKDPKNVAVRTDLGLTFYFREPADMDRAIREFKTALTIQPDFEKSLQNLASAYKAKGDEQNYRETVERLRKVNPGNPILKDSK